MGSHYLTRRVHGNHLTSIDSIHPSRAWSRTTFKLSAHPGHHGEPLPHQRLPVYPQTRHSTADGLDPLASINSNRTLYSVCVASHGYEARTHLPPGA